MKPDLDSLIAALRDQPLEHPLDQLEARVWSRIAALGRSRQGEGIWGWRAALTASMLATGAWAGGVALTDPGADPGSASPFAIQSDLAPSTLLGADG